MSKSSRTLGPEPPAARGPARRPLAAALAAAAVLAGASILLVWPTDSNHEAGGAPPGFLLDALGASRPQAPTVRAPAPQVEVRIDPRGYTVARAQHSVSLASENARGAWQRFAAGTSRSRAFGHETVTVGAGKTEQFLTVDRRLGERTWRWKLRTAGLRPRLGSGGSVDFWAGATPAGLRVLPPRILDAAGRSVSPADLAWRLERERSGWTISLRLDDAELPLPYVIDPAITYRSAASGANASFPSSPTTLTINKPPSVVENDFLLARLTVNGGTNTTITPPSGWTLARRDNNGTSVGQGVYYKVVGASEPASYAWNISSSSTPRAAGGILSYYGVDNTDPIDVSGSAIGTSTSVTAPSLTTTAANARIVALFGIDENTTLTQPTGMLERYEIRNANGSGPSASADDAAQAAAGATGSKTATAGISAGWVAQLVALHVDSVPPAAPAQSIAESSPDSHASGSTLFYRPAGGGGSFTVTSATSDGESGVQKVNFPGLAGGFTPTTAADDFAAAYARVYTWTTGATETGTKTVTASDNAANASTGTFTITPDSTAPATSDDTASIGSAWTSTDQTVTLTPSDGASGVAATYYTTDGSTPTTSSPQGTSISLTTEGVHTIKYFSVDNVGNVAPVQTAGTQIRIDKNPPTSSLSVVEGTRADLQHFDPATDTLYYNPAASGDFVIADAATDSASGVASVDFPSAAQLGFSGAAKSDTTSPYDSNVYTFDTTNVSAPAGQTVVVTDNSAKTTNDTISFVRDVSPPGAFSLAEPASGSFVSDGQAVSAAPSDADSGIAQVEFRYCAGPGCDFELGAPIGTDSSAPFSVAWTSQPSEAEYTIVARATDRVGVSTDSAPATVTVDNTDPSGGSITYPDGYATVLSVPVSTADGSDSSSGIAAGSGVVERDAASLSDGACGAFGDAWAPVTLSGGADTTVETGNCYRYRYKLSDNAGNEAIYTSSSVVKVDATPPSPSISLSENPADSDQHVAGTTLYFRPGGSGTFRVSAAATDAESGVSGVTFPAVTALTGGGSVASPGPYTSDYTWTPATTTSGAQTVTAVSGAGLANGADFTVTPDSTAPSGQSVALVGGPSYPDLSVPLSLAGGSDDVGGSGLDVNSAVVERDSAALSGGTCGSFSGSWTPVTLVGGADTSVGRGSCYRYRYRISDNVGNASASAPSADAMVAPGIGFRAALTGDNGAGATSLVLPVPGAVAAGDLLVAQVTFYGTTITPPAGWTLARRDDFTGSAGQAIYWHVAGASEPATYSWGLGATQRAAGAIHAYTGIDTTSPVDASSGQVGGPSVTASAPPLTTTAANELLLGFYASSAITTFTAPAGMIERHDATSAGLTSASASAVQASAGASGPKNATSAASGYWLAQLVALRPDTVAPAAPSQSISASGPDTYVSGATLYYRPTGGGGTFTISSTTSDTESAIDRVHFPGLSSGFAPVTPEDDRSSPFERTYAWTTGATEDVTSAVTAFDAAGNHADGNLTITPDAAAPSTTDDSASIGSAWQNTNQTVTLTPSDTGSGIAATYYTTDGSTPTTDSTQGTSVTLSTDGVYTIKYFSVDNVGNAEQVRTAIQIRIDKGQPSAATLDALPSAIRNGHLLTGSATDALSGVASLAYYFCPGTSCTPSTLIGSSSTGSSFEIGWSLQPTDGTYQVLARASDAAGNTLDSAQQTVTIDNAAPGSALSVVEGTRPDLQYFDPAGDTLYYKPAAAGDFTLENDATDAGSGVGSVTFPAISLTGLSGSGATDTSPSPYSSNAYGFDATNVAAPADQIVVVTDAAGNQTSETIAFARDVTAPSGQSIALAGGPYFTTASVGLTTSDGSDVGAGLDTASRLIERASAPLAAGSCGGFTTFGGSYGSPDASVVTGNCYRYRLTIADRVGNVSTAVSGDAKIDTGAPAVSLTDPGTNLRGTVALTATASDPVSAIASVTFQRSPAGAGTWTTIGTDGSSPYSVDFDTPSVAEGMYDLRAVATDAAGNSASVVVGGRRVDNTPPSATIDNPGSALTGTVTLTATVSDAGSGISTVTFLYSPAATDTWATIAADSNAPYSATWDTLAVNDGRYDLRVVAVDAAGNTKTSVVLKNRQVTNHPPIVMITAPGDYLNAGDPDPYTITANTSIGVGKSVSQVEFFTCSDASLSCSTGSWVSLVVDTAAPYSASWAVGGEGNRAIRAVITDNTSSTGTDVLNVLVDRTAPGGGSITYANGYEVAGSVAITTSNGSDAGSGLNLSSAVIQRDGAALADGSCGAFGDSWSGVSAPDTTMASGNCYRYRLRISDNAGNTQTYTSPNVVKVDPTPPTDPALDFSALTNASAAGSTVYYRPSAGAGEFTVGASSSDAQSGIAAYTFPAFGAGWTVSGSGATRTYSHTGGPTDPAEPNDVTAANSAGLSSTTSFTVTPDPDPPTGGSVAYADGFNSSGFVAITTDSGTDAVSGVDAASAVIERESATLAGGTCGTFSGSWTPVSAPDSTISGGTCYRYRHRISDMVGNVATYGSANVVKVTATPPTVPALTLTESPDDPDQHVAGTTLFFNPGAGSAGSFTVAADTSDPNSGIDKVVFPALPGVTGGGDDLSSPYQDTYGWTESSGASGPHTVTAHNNAGLTSDSTFTVTADGTAPSAHSATLQGGPYYQTLWVPLGLENGSDGGAGINPSSGTVERQGAVLADGGCSGWSGTWTQVALSNGEDTTVASGHCYRYRYSIADRVGNRSAFSAETGDAKVDAVAPTTTDNAPAIWRATDVTVTLSPTDAESGVAATEYRIDGGPYQPGATVVIPAPTDGSNDGTHTIAYRSRDVAGNVEAIRNTTVKIDVTPPVPVLLHPGDIISSVVTLSSTTSADTMEIVFERSPQGAGLQGTGLWVPIERDTSAPFSIDFDTAGLADGLYDLRARATDRAGNSTNSTSRVVRVLNSPPTGGSDPGGESSGGDPGGGTGTGDPAGGGTGGGTGAGSTGDGSGGGDSSGGAGTPTAKLTLKVFAPSKFSKRKRLVLVRIVSSRPANAKVVIQQCKVVAKRMRLASGKTRVKRKKVCKAVFSKRAALRAGTTRITLRVPKRVRPGRHSLVVTAVAPRPTKSSAAWSRALRIVR